MPLKSKLIRCGCCNALVSRWGIQRHRLAKATAEARAQALTEGEAGEAQGEGEAGDTQAQAEAGAQAQAPIVRHESLPPPKQRRITQFQTDAGSSSSGSGDPQLHAPSFDFNPSLPFPNPQCAEVSDRFIDDVLLNLHLHTWTH